MDAFQETPDPSFSKLFLHLPPIFFVLILLLPICVNLQLSVRKKPIIVVDEEHTMRDLCVVCPCKTENVGNIKFLTNVE